MNREDLIEKVAKSTLSTKTAAEKMVRATLDGLASALADGQDVTLFGLGNFNVKRKPARKGRNPQTKQEITIPAKTVIVFKAAKDLRDRLNG